jgi:hypothetical protein
MQILSAFLLTKREGTIKMSATIEENYNAAVMQDPIANEIGPDSLQEDIDRSAEFDSRPFFPAAPIVTHETIEKNPANGKLFVLYHKFKRVDAENISIYRQREKEVINIREEIGQGRSKRTTNSQLADENFYNALITGGRILPHGLTDEEKAHTTAVELTREQMLALEIETKQRAVRRMFKCKFVVTSSAQGDTGYGFLFAKDGVMTGTLYLPDKENPVYVVPMEFRRPEKSQRTEFKMGLYQQEDLRKGDLPKTKTMCHPEYGQRFFDNHFLRALRVDMGNPDESIPFTDNERANFLKLFSPMYKVEISAALVSSFDNDEQD